MQNDRAQLLGLFPPKARRSKGFAAASVKAVTAATPQKTVIKAGDGRQAVQGPRAGHGDATRSQTPPSNAVAAADPYEGATWGPIYEGGEDDLEGERRKEKLPVKPPIKPQTYFVAQPGRTALNFAAEWTGTSAERPVYMRLQLYRASDNKLMATRLVSRDTTESQGDTHGSCIWWILGTGSNIPKTCTVGVADGVLAGQTGVKFYAKISFATDQTFHWYK